MASQRLPLGQASPFHLMPLARVMIEGDEQGKIEKMAVELEEVIREELG